MIHQVIEQNVSLCKTRTSEPQRQEQGVVHQILEHVDFISNGETITDLRYDVLLIDALMQLQIQQPAH